jgi:hypothetical protein
LYIKAPAVQLTTAISIGDTYHIKGKKCREPSSCSDNNPGLTSLKFSPNLIPNE